MEYTREEDLERLLEALGLAKCARPVSPALVFEMALEEARKLKERDAAVNEPLRQAAMKMQVAVGNVLLMGGTEYSVWIDALVKCQQGLAAQTNGSHAEYEAFYEEVGRSELMKVL